MFDKKNSKINDLEDIQHHPFSEDDIAEADTQDEYDLDYLVDEDILAEASEYEQMEYLEELDSSNYYYEPEFDY